MRQACSALSVAVFGVVAGCQQKDAGVAATGHEDVARESADGGRSDGAKPIESEAGAQQDGSGRANSVDVDVNDGSGTDSTSARDPNSPIFGGTSLGEGEVVAGDSDSEGVGGAEGTSSGGGVGGAQGQGASDGVLDAGTGAASRDGSDGGEVTPETGCDTGRLRCVPGAALRQRCESGQWIDEDFSCATSVRVEDREGIACATKSNGEYACWYFGGRVIETELAPAGTVDSVLFDAAASAPSFLMAGGTLVLPDGSVEQDVVAFDQSADLCFVQGAGVASCLRVGWLGFEEASQVHLSLSLRCVLELDDTVTCDDWQDTTVQFPQAYRSIAVGDWTLCGLGRGGQVGCRYPLQQGAELLAPLEGSFVGLAMTDANVCAIEDSGSIRCATPSGGEPYTILGLFEQLDGGDHHFCAIDANGEVACWLHGGESLSVPEGW